MIKLKPKSKNISTQEYINLFDVKDGCLIGKDGTISQYIKVMPISTALMTDNEKARLTARMTQNISPTKTDFKIIFLTRPTDVRQLVEYYEGIKSMTVDTQKRESLTKTIRYFSQLSTNGGILERQTFLRIQKRTIEEAKSKTLEMYNALSISNVTCHICDDTEIVNMIGLFHLPAFNFSVPVDTAPKMTFLSGGKSDE